MQDQEKLISSPLVILSAIAYAYVDKTMDRLSAMTEKEMTELPTVAFTKDEFEFIKKFGCVFNVGEKNQRFYSLGFLPFKVFVKD